MQLSVSEHIVRRVIVTPRHVDSTTIETWLALYYEMLPLTRKQWSFPGVWQKSFDIIEYNININIEINRIDL